MAMEKQEKTFEKWGDPIKFEKAGESLTAFLVGIKDIKTRQYGPARLMLLETETGERVTTILTAGLSIFDWEKMTGHLVEITCEGFQKNPSSGNFFKSFDVAYDPEKQYAGAPF